MELSNKRAVVTGGSRGLGRAIVESLVVRGVQVVVVARHAAVSDSSPATKGVEYIAADITDESAARRILADIRPDILVLNAGATPAMAPFDETNWSDFSVTWDTDVKGGLYWMQSALRQPLVAGSRVIVSSSGAAQNGSPMSGGYGGAKKMLWLMAKYANVISRQKQLGIQFQTVVPMQMIGGTGVGEAGASAYAGAMGIATREFLQRFGVQLLPAQFGDYVAQVLGEPRFDQALALGVKGDSGITILEEAVA
jgi:NAD(P)-dependent dehydrogenase (short-subunit alcohol dehydrogenase family)